MSLLPHDVHWIGVSSNRAAPFIIAGGRGLLPFDWLDSDQALRLLEKPEDGGAIPSPVGLPCLFLASQLSLAIQ
jgi:hypothetical protein